MTDKKSINLVRVFSYLKPYRGRMVLAITALLISTGLGLLFSLLIVRLLYSLTLTKSQVALDTLSSP